MRTAEITRKTAETDIALRLCLDGGEASVDTGAGFLDHMLTILARHGGLGLAVSCKGDLRVDAHHSAEDVGICLGQAFHRALGERRGITRYGAAAVPMDEALVLAAVDISGRGFLAFDVAIPTQKVGEFDTELVKEFFAAFCRESAVTLHLRGLAGENSHHIIEAAFKAFAAAIKRAAAIDPAAGGAVPSTKGTLV